MKFKSVFEGIFSSQLDKLRSAALNPSPEEAALRKKHDMPLPDMKKPTQELDRLTHDARNPSPAEARLRQKYGSGGGEDY